MPDDDDQLVQRAQARVGVTLKDKWTIDKLLGLGGMAAVYAATHRNKKRVAIKMLHAELSADPDIRARFLREGYVANTVDHPGAVAVDDDDVTDDGAAFLVMELLQGETVEARCKRKGGRLSADDVLSISDQVLDVLIAAHAKGIVHRDLKPENLFLDRSGQLKVLDFGIARLRESRERSGTQTGSLMGTPAFMPPEQARGRWDDVDARSDLWAVGATMFSLLTGRLVHEAETANESLALAITQHAPSLASVLPDVSPLVTALVDRALRYQKDERYPDAAAMQTAVRDTYADLHDSSKHVRVPELSLPDATDVPGATVLSVTGTPSAAAVLATASAVTADAAPASPSAQGTTAGVTKLSATLPSVRNLPVVPIAIGFGVVVVVVIALAVGLRSHSSAAAASISGAPAFATAPHVAERTAAPVVTPAPQPAETDSAISVDQLPQLKPETTAEKEKPQTKHEAASNTARPPPAAHEPHAPKSKPAHKSGFDPFAERR